MTAGFMTAAFKNIFSATIFNVLYIIFLFKTFFGFAYFLLDSFRKIGCKLLISCFVYNNSNNNNNKNNKKKKKGKDCFEQS